jgi:K+/H+ antiporter YhaU regulatory subunit KhtT
MEVFNEYEKEVKSLINELENSIKDNKIVTDNSEKIDDLFSQVNDIIKQMSMETRSFESSTRKLLQVRVDEYQTNVIKHRTNYQRTKEGTNKSALLGDKSIEQRNQLLNTNERLARQNDMILSAQRTVADTEEVGEIIIKELGENRVKIENSSNNAKEFLGEIDAGQRILSSMEKREKKCIIS